MPVTAVVGTQWGDEGKGKIVDLLARDADMIIRANGGNNAGHTIENDNTKNLPDGVAKLHIVPAGIFNSKILNVIGAGTAVHIPTLVEEIFELEQADVSVENLIISKKAHLVMPWHILLDEAQEDMRSQDEKIGTTKRGMGPVFSDKYSRKGLRVGDLLKSDFKNMFFERFDENKHILNIFYKSWIPSTPKKLFGEFMEKAEIIRKFIYDAENEIHAYVERDANILLEGAQAVLLDTDYGTYPFCTSSACTVAGVAQGSGIPPSKITKRIGVVKAYTTRVGSGAFPTKLSKDADKELRELGNEYGATTGRARICGWIDLPLLKYANQLNDFTSIAITKLDVLSNMSYLNMGIGYGNCKAHKLSSPPCTDPSCGLLGERSIGIPVKKWSEDISEIKKYMELPKNARAYIRKIEAWMGCRAEYVSVGPHREQTIVR